ncbi:MAG: hypothetical protein ACE5HI_12655 [bacterium]
MTLYEFVAVFFLIIIGLGVAQLLQGIGQLLKYRQRINLYWVHLVWLIVLFMSYLGIWWTYFSQQERTYDFLLFLLDFSWLAILYLLTLLIFPDFPTEGVVDLRRHYFNAHRLFFGLWARVWVFMVLDSD